MQEGDRVWFWASRKGQRARIKSGLIIDIDHDLGYARVAVDSEETAVPTQTIAIERLQAKEPPRRPFRELRIRKPLDFGISSIVKGTRK